MVRDAVYSFDINVIFDKIQVVSLIKSPSSNVVSGKVHVPYLSVYIGPGEWPVTYTLHTVQVISFITMGKP